MAPKRPAPAAASTARAKSAKASSKSKSASAEPTVAATKRKSSKVEDAVEAPPSKRSKSTASATDSQTKAIPAKAVTKAKAKTPAKSTTAKAKASAKTKASAKPSAASVPSTPKATSKATKKRKAEDAESEAEQPAKRNKSMPAEQKTATAAKPKGAAQKPASQKPAAKKPAANKLVAKKGTKIEEQSSAEDDTPAEKPDAPKKATAPRKTAVPKSRKQAAEINTPPTTPLHVFVFGAGSQGELGLGHKHAPGKEVIDVKRPRLNPFLEELDVVQIAVGGMHCAVLTADNRIFTWGVNDQGALGRPAKQEGKIKDEIIDANDDSLDEESVFDEDSGLNPAEAEPREVDPMHFPEGTRFASLFAGDSTTFALTTTGLVYGWGTFRGNDGILGFSKDEKSKKGKAVATQNIPALIPELKNVKTMAVGANHAIALTHKGKAFVWGAGEQSQLGRRVVARTAAGALVPREFGLQKKFIIDVAAGEHCSYAIDKNGDIYSWGHNGFGQCGIHLDKNVDEVVQTPTKIDFLEGKEIAQIRGGKHHAIARTATGEVLFWGRIDESQGGLKHSDMPNDSLVFHETNGRPLAAIKPIVIPNLKADLVATASDTCFVITTEGKAYSWGFSTNYQTGQGTDDDIVEATLLDNTAVRGKKIVFAGAGGQFGILAGEKSASSAVPVEAPVQHPADLGNSNVASQATSTEAPIEESSVIESGIDASKATAVQAKIEEPAPEDLFDALADQMEGLLEAGPLNSPDDQPVPPEAAPAEASTDGI